MIYCQQISYIREGASGLSGIKPKSMRLGILRKYVNGINICPLSCIQEVFLRHIALLDATACVSLVWADQGLGRLS